MGEPRVFDAFLFSEPFETEILLAKLTIESPVVSNWLILENAFTFQGEFKGNQLQGILDCDQRFAPFLDRIVLISSELEFPRIDPTGDVDAQGLAAERRQRETARLWLEANAREDDWIMLSDTDEILDGTHDGRMNLLWKRIARCQSGVLPLPHRKFIFDFDNIFWPRRSTPIVSAQTLLSSDDAIASYRIRTTGLPTRWSKEIVFEYSFCFPEADILRKYKTFAHPGFDPVEIELAISCNRTPTAQRQNLTITRDPRFWPQPVPLTENNSPEYIRQNLDKLRTNVVPDNYQQMRKRLYPHLFSATGIMQHMVAEMRPKRLRRRISKRILGTRRW